MKKILLSLVCLMNISAFAQYHRNPNDSAESIDAAKRYLDSIRLELRRDISDKTACFPKYEDAYEQFLNNIDESSELFIEDLEVLKADLEKRLDINDDLSSLAALKKLPKSDAVKKNIVNLEKRIEEKSEKNKDAALGIVNGLNLSKKRIYKKGDVVQISNPKTDINGESLFFAAHYRTNANDVCIKLGYADAYLAYQWDYSQTYMQKLAYPSQLNPDNTMKKDYYWSKISCLSKGDKSKREVLSYKEALSKLFTVNADVNVAHTKVRPLAKCFIPIVGQIMCWPLHATLNDQKLIISNVNGSKLKKKTYSGQERVKELNMIFKNKLFSSCKTAGCVYFLAEDYKLWFSKILELNNDKVFAKGIVGKKLDIPSLRKVKKAIDKIAENAANNLPNLISGPECDLTSVGSIGAGSKTKINDDIINKSDAKVLEEVKTTPTTVNN